ncbi:MAG TPA: trigger factor [Patescibacteria group bacterium]|nr:trigger factor [Patescibacteria group bacterium]
MAKTDDKTPEVKTETRAPKAPAERYALERKPDGTLEVKIHVPWSEAEKVRETVVSDLVKQVEVPGFRKGTAPRNIAETKLKQESVREETLKKVLTQEYIAAVKALSINPIVNPKIHIEEFTDGTDIEITAETCEEPKIDLKNYKEEVKKIKPTAPKIIVPGQPEPEAEEPNKKLDEILDAILKVADVQIPKILIENETNRLLSQLLDELKRLGVDLDQYLASRGKKVEEIRAEYDERAEKDLKLEFVLRKIADEEKISVEKEDIENAINGIKDDKQKAEILQNPYLLAAIIRQQKTLDFLSKL